ncbi:MAG TPA: hypothetical protein DEA08_29475 [Planctomycetes bacterium]|nr:hypothetical protein [Planctomycetota bacterium]
MPRVKCSLQIPLCALSLTLALASAAQGEDALVQLARETKLPELSSQRQVARTVAVRALFNQVRQQSFAAAVTSLNHLFSVPAPPQAPHSPPLRFALEHLRKLPQADLNGLVESAPGEAAPRLLRAEAALAQANGAARQSPERGKALLEQAKRDLDKILESSPKHLRAISRRLTVARALREPPSAVASLIERARELDRTHYPLMRELLDYHRARQDKEALGALVKELREGHPQHPTTLRLMVDLHLQNLGATMRRTQDPRQRVQAARAYLQKAQQQIQGLIQAWIQAAPASPDPYLTQLSLGASAQLPPKQMFQLRIEAARRGDTNAMAKVAEQLLFDPRQRPETTGSALRYATIAALCGNLNGMILVGRALIFGRGLPANPGAGIQWLRFGVQAKHPLALGVLAECVRNGRGVQKDAAKARALHQEALKRGYGESAFWLGTMLFQGEGGPADPEGAARLFDQLARRGHPVAMAWLGDLYRSGKGVPQDLRRAAALYQQSAKRGYAKAQQMLESLLAEHPELRTGGGGGAQPR